MQKLISFTVYAEKGFMKKPDINEGMYLTYNMLHKPAVLGILGAITGLGGYKKNQEFPEYYTEYKSIPIGIKPENDDKGNFQKTIIAYNNTTGLASNEAGGNLIVTEQTLIAPSYTIFLLLDLEIENQKSLYKNIKNQEAVYLPYLGKNDYSLWWKKEEVQEYEFEKISEIKEDFKLTSIFNKKNILIQESEKKDELDDFNFLDISSFSDEKTYIYFERLPTGFNEQLFQYSMGDFVFTNVNFKKTTKINSIYYLPSNDLYIQLN